MHASYQLTILELITLCVCVSTEDFSNMDELWGN